MSGLSEGRMGGNFAKSSQNAPSDFFKVNNPYLRYLSLSWPWRDRLYLYDCERQASGVQQRVVAMVECEKERTNERREQEVDVRKAS